MKDKIHLVEFDEKNMPYYKCNWVVGVATLTKITQDIKKVTCKNCLRKNATNKTDNRTS